MEPPREDPLMLLHGSWVEVAPFGAPDPQEDPGPKEEDEDEEDPLEAILREAQMEASASASEQRPRRGDGGPPAPKGPSEEDRSPAAKREDPERPPHCGTLDWPWPGPTEPLLPPKELSPICPGAPPCAPRLARKKGLGLRDPQVLLLVGPSLLLSHVLALGLGICLGKRLAASSSSSI